MDTPEHKVGSIIAARNSMDSLCKLALVVDQKAGQRWVDSDPFIGYFPEVNERHKYVLARLLGTNLHEGISLGRTPLLKNEPQQIQTVRWAYVQKSQSWMIAGPDVQSIQLFLHHARTCDALGMGDATFFYHLDLIVEYLKGERREPDATSHFEKQYRAMLEDVLPRA